MSKNEVLDTEILSILQFVLQKHGIENGAIVKPFGNGLINCTWKVTAAGKEYILQKINHQVFTKPENIATNCTLIADYLKKHHPDYLFIAPIESINGDDFIYDNDEGYYRLLPFVKNSHAKDIVETPAQAYEAAKQFGCFTRLLSGFDINRLKVTIPSFHDLTLRYSQFMSALKNGNELRIGEAKKLVEKVSSFAGIVKQYEAIKLDASFKLRVTHHDTKISNVLFDENDKGICVIDLDTVMPGYFISDVGDMMRTYLCPVNEEEAEFSKIEVREEFYKAVVEGYGSEMKDELTGQEKEAFFFTGKFMIYMQAIRFLTDYLNDDVYYGAKYDDHNLVRATNQMMLLEELAKRENDWKKRYVL